MIAGDGFNATLGNASEVGGFAGALVQLGRSHDRAAAA